MKLPNAEHAHIEREKVVDYLLNTQHRRGGSKARLLLSLGYDAAQWEQLVADIRRDHCPADIARVRDTLYGRRYEIRAALITPSSRQLIVRSIWQIDTGNTIPRLITLFPD